MARGRTLWLNCWEVACDKAARYVRERYREQRQQVPGDSVGAVGKRAGAAEQQRETSVPAAGENGKAVQAAGEGARQGLRVVDLARGAVWRPVCRDEGEESGRVGGTS